MGETLCLCGMAPKSGERGAKRSEFKIYVIALWHTLKAKWFDLFLNMDILSILDQVDQLFMFSQKISLWIWEIQKYQFPKVENIARCRIKTFLGHRYSVVFHFFFCKSAVLRPVYIVLQILLLNLLGVDLKESKECQAGANRNSKIKFFNS